MALMRQVYGIPLAGRRMPARTTAPRAALRYTNTSAGSDYRTGRCGEQDSACSHIRDTRCARHSGLELRSSMRLVVISDTHNLHNGIQNLPDGDVLVHAGDFMGSGYDPEEIRSFNRWLGEQPFRHRVVCCGNHDRYFQDSPQQARSLLTNAIFLENTGVTIDNVSFWGSPYTPEFQDWAFMYPRGSGGKYWDKIPYNLDVLITHGPPYGILDQAVSGSPHLGCKELLEAVEEKKPRVHLFGHIHGGCGTFENGATRFVNAAYLNEQYQPLEPAGKVRIVDL